MRMADKVCYCGKNLDKEKGPTLVCLECKVKFHLDCLKTGKPSNLHGDVFFDMTCSRCGDDSTEQIERSKLPWLTIVSIALYNLHLSGNGKHGYFRWKEHICAYIDKHWSLLLGPHKKKTSLWYGTVAGALSSGCPIYFTSGSVELGEPGWWKLTDLSSPICKPVDIVLRKGRRHEVHQAPVVKMEGLRARSKKSAIEAAIELKERRLRTSTVTQSKKDPLTNSDRDVDQQPVLTPLQIKTEPVSDPVFDYNVKIKEEPLDTPSLLTASTSSTSDLLSTSSSDLLTNQDLLPQDKLPDFLLQDDEIEGSDESDIEIDPDGLSPNDSSLSLNNNFSLDDLLSNISDPNNEDVGNIPDKTIVSHIKTDPEDSNDDIEEEIEEEKEQGDDDEEDEEEDEEEETSVPDESSIKKEPISDGEEEESELLQHLKDSKPRVRVKKEVLTPQPKLPQYKAISLYEEQILLDKLKQAADIQQLSPELTRFKQKLIVRKLKRERGLPVFDLDHEVNKRLKSDKESSETAVQFTRFPRSDLRVLDRFQIGNHISVELQPERPCFINRLIGTDDDQLQSIRSPYTTRILKPFIRRDFESRPLRMKLLEEIKAYPHRNDKNWKSSDPPSIDYCYVRPEHIPSVNILSQQFFWPHIDLSECLHYPDFSCVVLFRKIVIGFAFMVPDVKYNEAYISYLFTHPEWRRAGIAKFMVYHLIQTCMGKDVTLHVSATNPAMLLYQKFGFKPEEFLLDFYDKYYPVDSKECKHAYFLRLRR